MAVTRHAEAFDVRAEHVARLLLLGFGHINMLCRNTFIMPIWSPLESFNRFVTCGHGR